VYPREHAWSAHPAG